MVKPLQGVQLSWSEAAQRAGCTLQKMTATEKRALMQGVGWQNKSSPDRGFYVGTTPAVERLGLPALKMQDASGGFRPLWEEQLGTVTAWPSLLALAASFNPELVRSFGAALGREFRGKGANGVLGPSVNVHRVARGGRNFEYLSGEDPFLGSILAPAYVAGVHSEGVFTVAKHYVLNSQETNREDFSASADEKTLQELYLPPFRAAIDAGVAAVMCAYNKVDGEYACSNDHQLWRLKKDLGFSGFVQSDWWATHDVAVSAGLDQEMPGSPTSTFLSKGNLSKIDGSLVDAAASRILATMHKFGLDSSSCAPPDCYETQLEDVTSSDHTALARRAVSESVVMLKNTGGILPLANDRSTKYAIVGAAANAPSYNPLDGGPWNVGDYYSGGGSGHMVTTQDRQFTVLEGVVSQLSESIELVTSLSNDFGAAVDAARDAEVALVVLGATSGEAEDRRSLDLDCWNCAEGQTAAGLVEAVAAVAPTVVVVLAPGAVLLPFRDLEGVRAILTLFLGGEQTGHGIADVLFGTTVPSGRLPVQLPAAEEDTIAPSDELAILYSEGLATSYRSSASPAYPFGFGLGFTTFGYSDLSAVPYQNGFNVSLQVTNTGDSAGRDVPQLYLEFPEAAGQPRSILKGFQKTSLLESGQSQRVTFTLTHSDLTHYDASSGTWMLPDRWTAHVGASSADLPLQLCLGLCDIRS